jgi:hypothetical protein
MNTLAVFFCLLSAILPISARDEDSLPRKPDQVTTPLTPMISSEISEDALLGKAHEIAKKLEEEGVISADDYDGKNTKSDYLWVVARGLASAAAYTLYLNQSRGLPLEKALAVGFTGLLLSGGFQAATPWYVKWVTKKGVFYHSKQDAGFVETWLKEYSLQWLYIGIFQLVGCMVGVEENFMSFDLIKTVTYSWITEGAWSLIIAKWVSHMRDKLKDRPRLAWNLGKGSYFGLSLLASILMVSSLHGSQISEMTYYFMMTTGMSGYLYFFTPLGQKLKLAVKNTKQSCRMKIWDLTKAKASIRELERNSENSLMPKAGKEAFLAILRKMRLRSR